MGCYFLDVRAPKYLHSLPLLEKMFSDENRGTQLCANGISRFKSCPQTETQETRLLALLSTNRNWSKATPHCAQTETLVRISVPRTTPSATSGRNLKSQTPGRHCAVVTSCRRGASSCVTPVPRRVRCTSQLQRVRNRDWKGLEILYGEASLGVCVCVCVENYDCAKLVWWRSWSCTFCTCSL